MDHISLLRSLISTPSLSREEAATADIWQQWLLAGGAAKVERVGHNVLALPRHFAPSKPILMLNSHHDTVRPAASYTRAPFSPDIEGDFLYGLGSNDAGASGVALASVFLSLQDDAQLPVNLLLAITAEEEVTGAGGMRALLPYLKDKGLSPDMAIVGEPTGMQPAIAERGLLVLDCEAKGVSGHAARGEGVNALYRAIDDIATLRAFAPPKVSATLGPIKVSVTMIECGTQHNVVPDTCRYVADVRTTDAYSNQETLNLLRQCVSHSTLSARSTHIQASVIATTHPLVRAATAQGLAPFVSPTTSDMAVLTGIPSLKIGPGDSARSHTANEYVRLSEIEEAILVYTHIIKHLDIQ